MPNEVTEFLKALAAKEGFTVFDSLSGSIELGQSPRILQSSGAVYGIWVSSSDAPSAAIKPLPDHPGWYPVYWGIDISPVSRMKAHVQGHAQTGNVNLPAVAEVVGKRIIYGAILVSQYASFEAVLHSRFPPLRGTGRRGRVSTLISIEN